MTMTATYSDSPWVTGKSQKVDVKVSADLGTGVTKIEVRRITVVLVAATGKTVSRRYSPGSEGVIEVSGASYTAPAFLFQFDEDDLGIKEGSETEGKIQITLEVKYWYEYEYWGWTSTSSKNWKVQHVVYVTVKSLTFLEEYALYIAGAGVAVIAIGGIVYFKWVKKPKAGPVEAKPIIESKTKRKRKKK